MKTIFLDAGPVITLALNNLLWVLKKVKKDYNIRFCITEGVKKEIIDNPLTTKRFKFEALQVLNLLRKGTLELVKDEGIEERTNYILEIANSIYKAKGRFLTLIHYAEISTVAAALLHNADAVMIDERTTRYMVEKPTRLKKVLEHKLHTKVEVNSYNLSQFKKLTKGVKFIRSAEFATIVFEKGLLDDFLPNIPNARKNLLEALLWGLKLNGCAISKKDLEVLLGYELKNGR